MKSVRREFKQYKRIKKDKLHNNRKALWMLESAIQKSQIKET